MRRNVMKPTFGHALSEDSDQPTHSRSLIRIFPWRILDSQGCKDSSCGQQLFLSNCSVVQADLSRHWTHKSERTLFHAEVIFS